MVAETAREIGYKRPKSLRENIKLISLKSSELDRIITSIKNKENLQEKYSLPKSVDELHPKIIENSPKSVKQHQTFRRK